jgi:hypothetical protein
MPVEAAQQQAFYDRLTKQLEARRAGPSTAEQLFQLSAALAAPTTVRGFSGVLNNVMPVLQQQAQARREGATSREDALTALQLQQMKSQQGLTGQEVAYRTALARLAGVNQKPRTGFNPVTGTLTDMNTGSPISNSSGLPVLTVEQAIQARLDPANVGKKFQTPDGREGTL